VASRTLLGIAGFASLAIVVVWTVMNAIDTEGFALSDLQTGAWMALAGALVALLDFWLGRRPRSERRSRRGAAPASV
jgi:membrane associated rhomboid family serine protease